MFTPRSLVPLRRILFACGVSLVGLSSAIAQTAISTLAGSSPAIASGNIEGIGTAARFNALASVAVDSTGNIYVADAGNHTIRKVTAAGVVTTLAGSGVAGSANGTGAAASFRFPQGVATDNTNGNSAYSLETKGRWYHLSGDTYAVHAKSPNDLRLCSPVPAARTPWIGEGI